MIKPYLKLIALPLILSSIFTCTAVSSLGEECSWYIKKQGSKSPIFPMEAEELTGLNVYYIDKSAEESGEKVIYLTFDAGYENGNISKTLDILKDKKVTGAFFILDNLLYKNTDLVNRMFDEGHAVCNHTSKHRNLSECTVNEISDDLGALENLCLEKTGKEMSRHFRFPEGRYSKKAIESVRSLGYNTFFWSFGYEDWDNSRQPGEEYAIKKILTNTHPGEILLLHPTSDTNVKILPTLIDKWRDMGYTFGTLDSLVEKSSK